MTVYKLEYIATRAVNGNIIPAEQFDEPIVLDYQFDNYNEADLIRCELCSKFNYGYVRVVQTDDLR